MPEYRSWNKVANDEQTEKHNPIDDAVWKSATPKLVSDERSGSTNTPGDFNERLPAKMPANRPRERQCAARFGGLRFAIHNGY
jgi:hypothetical protein